MDKAFTVEDKTRRWEYHREIKNLMGRYMFSLLTLREAHIFNDFWAKAHADICLGFNDGWYVGRESIEAYYRAWDESNQAADGKMKAMFPEKPAHLCFSVPCGAYLLDLGAAFLYSTLCRSQHYGARFV